MSLRTTTNKVELVLITALAHLYRWSSALNGENSGHCTPAVSTGEQAVWAPQLVSGQRFEPWTSNIRCTGGVQH
jgi:hypothetical protein